MTVIEPLMMYAWCGTPHRPSGIVDSSWVKSVPGAKLWKAHCMSPHTSCQILSPGVFWVTKSSTGCGSPQAEKVLVLNPGTSASSTYFEPLAKTIVSMVPKGWQVWAVERRENLLEDHSVLNQAKKGKATPQQMFDYYLGS